MFSEKLERQDFAVRLLRSHLEQNRMSHAYLLTGANSPKDTLALALAAAANCLNGRMFGDCDCASCHKVSTGNHPDIEILGEDLKIKSIKIEEIRKLTGGAGLKPYEGKWKVFILQQAGRLTPDASNALLKTLEEPPEHTLLILTAESRSQLLETIQSRCFEIRLKPETFEFKEASLLSISGKSWEEYLGEQSESQRGDVKELLDGLMGLFRRQISENPAAAGNVRRLRALDLLLETKDAIDSNVNSKLALTRLAVHFHRLTPEKI